MGMAHGVITQGEYLMHTIKLVGGTTVQVDKFTLSYLAAALWSSNDESDETGGEPLDSNYGPQDIHPDAIEKMVADCVKFQADNADLITEENFAGRLGEHGVEEMAGHDFWLTRNGHGCGFFDGDWEEDAGEKLTASSKSFKETNLFLGDDELIDIV